MRIRPEIVRKYWHEAALAELASTYATKGYEVKQRSRIGNYEADLVARKGKELIVVEVKADDWPKEKIAQVQHIRNEVVHELGGKFNLVLVSPPQEKFNEIDGLEEILGELVPEYCIDDMNALSSDTRVEAVLDAVITSLVMEKNRLRVKGSASVSLSLTWGSSSDFGKDDGLATKDSYPLEFDLVLDGNLEVLEVNQLRLDISSYYQ